MTYPPEHTLIAAAANGDWGTVEILCRGCIAWTPEEYEELMRVYEASPKGAFNPVPIKSYSAAWQP